METQPSSPEAVKPVATETASARVDAGATAVGRNKAWPVLLAVVLALWLGQAWYAHQQIDSLQTQLARHAADNDLRLKESRALARADHESLENLQNKVGALEGRLAETQSQSVALAAMYQDIVRGRDERLLAEIEQSIAIAAQQLQLAGNVEAALIALQTADTRLAGSSQARFVPIRRLIARDIERLKSLPTSDLTGLSLKIDSVVAVVDSLPLAFEQRPQAGTKPGAASSPASSSQSAESGKVLERNVLERLGRDVWHEFRQLIRIERIDYGDPALLAPSQTFFLRENLRLRLLSARLALLQRESSTYRHDLRQVRELLERYFDVRSKPVQAALTTVTRLSEANLALDMPTLNETLMAVRTLKFPRGPAG
jgi:uroporphyrin-3 C-methyltransferase